MMPTAVTNDPAALAASIAQWWALAGVDVAVQDMPRDWLAKPRPAAAPAAPPATVPATRPDLPAQAPPQPISASPAPPARPMPDTLDMFLEWLATDPGQPEAAFSQARILPRATARPDLLVITDMPTQDDMNAGTLFSGADADLLSNMLRAMGIEADRTATASLFVARPTGGIVDDGLQ
ncbi:MAG: hypothetical protein QM690_15950, partial [Sphingobium sp.]